MTDPMHLKNPTDHEFESSVNTVPNPVPLPELSTMSPPRYSRKDAEEEAQTHHEGHEEIEGYSVLAQSLRAATVQQFVGVC